MNVNGGNRAEEKARRQGREKVCLHSRDCGACAHVNMPYDRQLQRKQAYIADLFSEFIEDKCILDPIMGMEDPFRFRDKIASPFAPGKKLRRDSGSFRGKGSQGGKGAGKIGKAGASHEVLYGMYARGTHRIIAIDTCPVENECGRRIVRAVAQLMRKYGIEPYNEDTGAGFMRHVVVRVGHESGEVLVTLVTNGSQFPGAKNFARNLVKRCPEITTVVQNVNTKATNAILGNEEHVIYGPGFILDTLCGLSFRISSHSFYQVNAVQTEVLYRLAVGWALSGTHGLDGLPGARRSGVDHPSEGDGVCTGGNGAGAHSLSGTVTGIEPNDTAGAGDSLSIMDAYCGTGTIGLVAASMAGNARVVGVDKVESSIRDARQNAAHNGIENARFVTADAGVYLRSCAAKGERFDVLIMDPPRAGSSEEFLSAAAASGVGRIVYISCNPETQVRDVRYLSRLGYRIERIRPVDMFPHTDHVETCCLMSRVKE